MGGTAEGRQAIRLTPCSPHVKKYISFFNLQKAQGKVFPYLTSWAVMTDSSSKNVLISSHPAWGTTGSNVDAFLFFVSIHASFWWLRRPIEVRRNITGGSLKVIQQPATLWRLLEGSVAQGTANTFVPYYQSKPGEEGKVLSWYCHGNLVAYLLFWGVPPRTRGSTNGGMLGYWAEIRCCQLVSQENTLMHGSHAG